MNLAHKKFDVLIVGGSFVGLSIAAALRNNGFKCAILERSFYKKNDCTNDPGRLLAISSASVDVLKQFGIVTNFEGLGQEINHIIAFEGSEKYKIDFDPETISKHDFGYMIDESVLLAELHKSIGNDIEFFSEAELINLAEYDNQVHLSLKNYEITANMLIIADGKNSKFRALSGIEYYRKDYKQQALVCEIEHEVNHEGVAVEIFMPEGPFAILPKKGGLKSCIVWTLENDLADSIKTLNAEDIESLIADRFNSCFGEMKVTSNIKFFHLDLIVSKQYYNGRKVLVGDSLHAIHPLAGQGLNLSIKDINSLCSLLIKNRNLGLDYGNQIIFEEYRRQREFDNNLMIEATHNLNCLFSNSSLLLKTIRKNGLKIVNSSKILKKKFIEYACGV